MTARTVLLKFLAATLVITLKIAPNALAHNISCKTRPVLTAVSSMATAKHVWLVTTAFPVLRIQPMRSRVSALFVQTSM